MSTAKTEKVTLHYLLLKKRSDGTLEVDRRIHRIRITTTEYISDLEDALHKRVDHRETVKLWMPKEAIELGNTTGTKVTKLLRESTLDEQATFVNDIDQTVDTLMRRGDLARQCKYVHLLVVRVPRFKFDDDPPVQLPAIPADTTAFLTEQFRGLLIATSETNSPSVNAKSVKYLRHQGTAFAILDGRYDPDPGSPTTQAPPIELFHPIFAEFLARVADVRTNIPAKVVCDTASLMRSVSAISTTESDESIPMLENRMCLARILEIPFATIDFDESSASHVALGTAPRVSMEETTALALVEEKGELGIDGRDPSVQGSFSYAKFWAADDHQRVRDNCCCPTFIIALAGPWLAILGAVTTSRFIVQRLTDYLWLGNSRVIDDAHILRVARTLNALRLSLRSLDAYYQSLTPAPEGRLHPRFFPSITSYRSDDMTIEFTYKEPLQQASTCVTFLATMNSQDARPVVVKFVERYGHAVHQLLADQGLAPELIYYGPIGGDGVSYGELKMVVMEYIQGETLAGYFGSGPIAQDVLAAVKEGMTAIHAGGFVFGDLRRQNVMIADAADDNPEADLGQRVRFIDFDWAGRAGEVRYPLHLSDSICIRSGASEYELISEEHDIKMLAAL